MVRLTPLKIQEHTRLWLCPGGNFQFLILLLLTFPGLLCAAYQWCLCRFLQLISQDSFKICFGGIYCPVLPLITTRYAAQNRKPVPRRQHS